MGRRWRRRGLALAALCVFGSAPAHGQYRPPGPAPEPALGEPAPPPGGPGRGLGELGPADAGPVRRTGGWEPLFVIEGVYEQNVGFAIPQGPDDYVGSIQAALTRWHRTPRGEVRLTLDGAGFAYRQLSSRNRADGGVALRLGSRLARRVEGSLRGRFAYGHSDTEALLVDSAVLVPLVRTRAGDASGGLSWQLGERTSWSLDGAWRRVDFDSEVLLDTQAWTAETKLGHRLSRRDGLSLGVQFLRVEDALSIRHQPSGTLGFTSQVSREVSVELHAGAGRSETVAGIEAEPLSWTAQGGAGLTVSTRRGFLSIRYEHGLQPIPGLGVTRLTDLAALRAVIPIGRWLEIVANGSFALRDSAGNDASRRSREADAFAGAALRLARRLRLVAGYRLRYRDDSLQAMEIRNNRGSVSLAWGPESLTWSPESLATGR